MSQYPGINQNILTNENIKKVADEFHSHLDECKQCRDHPFALCPIGRVLLLKVNHPVSNK